VKEKAGTGGVRVATLNLWGRRGEWNERRRVLVEGFRELEPDLVAFQEAVVGDGYDQVTDLLGSGYHVAHQTDREAGRGGDIEDGQGISVASRWPLGEVWEPDLNVTPRTEDFACGTIIVEVFAPEPVGLLLFVNHLPNWQLTFEHERELQTVVVGRAIEKIAESRDLHVVLAGDLDATPDAASVRFWRGRQSLGGMSVCYRDAWESTHPDEPGHTFTAENPLVTAENWDWELELGRRIDHVFVRCTDHGPTLDIRNCKRIFDKPIDGVWGSDHFGVVADLSVQTSSGRPVRLSTKGRRARFWARLTCCSIHWHCGLLGT
jgi:endonuclease/exonuclease/phosphatase family metal-dependent hydrolase